MIHHYNLCKKCLLELLAKINFTTISHDFLLYELNINPDKYFALEKPVDQRCYRCFDTVDDGVTLSNVMFFEFEDLPSVNDKIANACNVSPLTHAVGTICVSNKYLVFDEFIRGLISFISLHGDQQLRYQYIPFLISLL